MTYVPSGPARPSSLAANLPYLVVIMVSATVLVSYLMLADPLGGDGGAPTSTLAATTSTTEAATPTSDATTTLPIDTTTTTPEATTTTGPPGSRGEELFRLACQLCHGPGGEGIEGLGKPLTTSTFAAGLTDDQLLAFLIEGRAADDPLNTTGIAMPPRGGVSSFSDDDLRTIVAYLRTLTE